MANNPPHHRIEIRRDRHRNSMRAFVDGRPIGVVVEIAPAERGGGPGTVTISTFLVSCDFTEEGDAADGQ